MRISLGSVTGVVTDFLRSSLTGSSLNTKAGTQTAATPDSRAIEHMIATMNASAVSGVKWGTPTHDQILEKALPSLHPGKLEQIKVGSASVDRNLGNTRKLVTENTLIERMAPRHAMTPGSKVKELGLEKARAWARNEADIFINTKMEEAKRLYGRSFDADSALMKDMIRGAAYRAFGAGTHTIMDDASPAHHDFQVYDTSKYKKPIGGLGTMIVEMGNHSKIEGRAPTEAEMNGMVDIIRLRFEKVFGTAAYKEAVPENERRQTEQRLKNR